MPDSWFRLWFNDAYKRLYPHRDAREAEAQARFVLRMLPVTPEWRILDVGCGSGRHLAFLRKQGYLRCLGLDLSLSLLRDARAEGQAVARGDMRHLPYRRAGFDLVTSFFTSFGYFATFEEDVEALAEMVSVLKPGGFLFLDLINKGHLVRHLVGRDSRSVDGALVEQRRRLEGPLEGPGTVVVKEIDISRPDGSKESYQERVRLYPLQDMLALASRFGLKHIGTFGDEKGCAYRSEDSPRMAILFQTGAAPRGN
jgi:SAM-dependent methyltransferase